MLTRQNGVAAKFVDYLDKVDTERGRLGAKKQKSEKSREDNLWEAEHETIFKAKGLSFVKDTWDSAYADNKYYESLPARERSLLLYIDKMHPLEPSGEEEVVELYLG